MKKQVLLSLLFMAFSAMPFSGIFAQKSGKSSKSQDDKSWPGYFKMFQAAVKSGDKAKIMKLCYLSSMGEDSFNDAFPYFFEGDAKKNILKAKHNDAKKTEQEFEGLGKAKKFTQLSFEESGSDDEGNVYESALIYYFAKVNGRYKLVYLMAAG